MVADCEPFKFKRLKRLNISGHARFLTFSTYQRMRLLTNDVWRQWLADEIRCACDDHEVALWAYVFMPEHVHVLVKPHRDDARVDGFLQSCKEKHARRVVQCLQQLDSPLLARLLVQERPGKWCYRFWQEGGGFDRNITSMVSAFQTAEYCHSNPVKRHLVETPDRWRWSSFRWLVLEQRADVPLKVDEWDEAR